jgi:hypothetical protein
MKRHHFRYWTALTGVSDAAPRSIAEIRELQRRAWDEDGLIILSRDDERLNDVERIDLHRIGDRLYRRRRSHRTS